MRLERYWSPRPAEIRYPRDEDYAAHFLDILQRSVTDRLRGAGSFAGIAMSGGLDSTSVAALAQRSPGTSVRAYTFVFDRLAECDERSYSRAMTEELGLEVEPIEAEGLWSLESRSLLPLSPDTPFVGWRACHQEIFRRMGANGSRVLLMGHGGDDLLRGSSLSYAQRLRRGNPRAVLELIRHAKSRDESLLRVLYRHLGRPVLPVAVDQWLRAALGFQAAAEPVSLLLPDFARRTGLAGRGRALPSRTISGNLARQEIYANLVSVPWYWRLANWYDRSAAAFGIEVRQPFLDRRLFEYILAIPGEQLFRVDLSKSLLRRSMEGILPDRIRLRKRKTRFGTFLDSGLRGKASGEIRELLRAPLATELGILDGKRLEAAFLAFLDGGTDESRRTLWYALTLEIWLRRYKEIRNRQRQALAGRFAA